MFFLFKCLFNDGSVMRSEVDRRVQGPLRLRLEQGKSEQHIPDIGSSLISDSKTKLRPKGKRGNTLFQQFKRSRLH